MGVSDRAWKIVPQFRGSGIERSIAKRKKIYSVSKCTTWLGASGKFKLLFPYGVCEFYSPVVVGVFLPLPPDSFSSNKKKYLSWQV